MVLVDREHRPLAVFYQCVALAIKIRQFIYLFKANIRPEIGSCVRVEFNYINKRTSYTYINFGSIYEADCDGLMSSHEVSSAGGDAMKKKWHYRRSRG